MAKLNENYETIMIFNTKNGDEAIKALVEKFTGLIETRYTGNRRRMGQTQTGLPNRRRGRRLLRIRYLHQRSRVPC